MRERSINILKDAVKNRKLGAYKGASRCKYYHKDTDSCCAVGALIPHETLMSLADSKGDVSSLDRSDVGNIKEILKKSEWKNDTGMTDDELIELQRLHDSIIVSKNSPEEFENYVNSLV